MASKDQGWSWLFGKLYGLLSRNPPSNRMVVELADLQPGERVLDIGGGSGSALVAAAEIVGAENVAGADPTGPLAEKVRKRIPGAEVVQAGAEDLPFPDASFDVVCPIASFHHWGDPDRGLTQVLRVLRPGGRFLLTERRIGREGGHGLSEGEATEVAADLERIGFVETTRRLEKAGRHTFFVFVAKKP